MAEFLDLQPSDENQWRALILFGRNVASYKFALARSLLDVAGRPDDLVRLEELAIPFAAHLRAHLRQAPKQATSSSSRFLEECRRANAGEIGEDELRGTTVRLGFNNVLNAFHRLGPTDVSTRFFVDERRESGGIRLTEQLRRMAASSSALDLEQESEARWRLVETAWELGVSHSIIEHERDGELLTVRRRGRRVTVTSVRAALNGYQKGKCFYCFSSISTTEGADLADVDHFFPWALRAYLPGNINGVWNLVLACQRCNRGAAGKFDLIPPIALLERLHRRNEFLITSHHPLRETLMLQTGASSTERTSFLQSVYDAARLARVNHWDPPPAAGEAAF
jgi:hypothetical protein